MQKLQQNLRTFKPVILFDGSCNLCNSSLKFIIKRDKENIFQYFPIQSREGDIILKDLKWQEPLPDSIILIEKGKLYVRSDAVFRILPYLGKFYKILNVFKILPPKLRDGIYNYIASHRFRWFGKSSGCELS